MPEEIKLTNPASKKFLNLDFSIILSKSSKIGMIFIPNLFSTYKIILLILTH